MVRSTVLAPIASESGERRCCGRVFGILGGRLAEQVLVVKYRVRSRPKKRIVLSS
jgi:hypothetical protein